MAVHFWVLLGSGLGGLARYWVGSWVAGWAGAGFPWGTLLINVVGSFVIGLVGAGIVERGWSAPVDLRAFVMVGLCGGFTTFSAFSLQMLELLQAARPAARAAMLAAPAIALSEGLNMGLLLLVSMGVVSCGVVTVCRWAWDKHSGGGDLGL